MDAQISLLLDAIHVSFSGITYASSTPRCDIGENKYTNAQGRMLLQNDNWITTNAL
jgi:hypothetical protein